MHEETGRELRERIFDPRGYMQYKTIFQAMGANFNVPGQSLSDMKVTILGNNKTNHKIYFLKIPHTGDTESLDRCGS